MAHPHKISIADWQKNKSTICRLYKDEDIKSQYMRQFKVWHVQKNRKGNFWKDVSLNLKSKHLTVDDVDIFLDGQLVPSNRLKRQISRNDLPTLKRTTIVPRIPAGIFIRPRIQIPRSLIISLPWHQICAQLEIALSRRKDRSPSPLPSAVLDVTDEWSGLRSNYYWEEEVPSLPREIAMNQACLPSLEFLDQRTLQKASRDINIVDAGIAGVLNLSDWCTSWEGIASTMAKIARFMPERRPGEIEDVANQLIDPNSTKRMQVFMSFAALMLANNLLHKQEVDAFVIALDEIAGPSAFDMLPLRDDPSTRAIISELLFAAVRVDKPVLVKSAMKKGISVNTRSVGKGSKTLILEAVEWGRIRIVEMLIDAGADITPGRRVSSIGHQRYCPLFKNEAECTASEYCQRSAFYFECEIEWARNECVFSIAAMSRKADELIPLLLKSPASILAGPVIVQAIFHGASKETVEMLLRKGAAANECGLFRHDICEEDHQRSTALGAAVSNGDIEMARLLLDYGANPNGPIDGRHKRVLESMTEWFYHSPLVVAAECKNLDMVQLLVERGADPNWSALDIIGKRNGMQIIRSEDGPLTRFLYYLPLQAATSLEDPAMTQYLLSKGAATNPGHGIPPLSIAAYHGRDATVDLLIRSGAMINAVDAEMSALEGAVCSGSETLVQRMISAGADLDRCLSARSGSTALQRAAAQGFGAIFDILRRAGARLDSSSTPNHATTILQGFVKHHDYERSLELLKEGVSPKGKCKDGSSPLIAATQGQDLRLMSLLLEYNADANDAYPSSLRDTEVKTLSNNHGIGDMLQSRLVARPPVQWAVAMGNLDAVTCLCNAGADVNKRGNYVFSGSSDGLTALHLAVVLKQTSIVEFLLGHGAEVNTIFNQSLDSVLTPIVISVANSDFEITNILLQHGADPYLGQLDNSEDQEEEERRRCDKRLALEQACYSGDVEMTRFLISSGVDVHVGYPLVFTFQTELSDMEQREEIMELLLAKGVDINHRHSLINTPLQAALWHGCYNRYFTPLTHGAGSVPADSVRAVALRCARRLIELDADINALPGESYGRTALQAVVEIGDVEFVRDLLSRGAEVNAPAAPHRGVTALQAAAITGSLRIAQILLEHGAEIDADPSPMEGRRAIDGAAERGHIDMVKLLLDNYNGPRTISNVCESAMEYAKGNKQWYMMEFLEAYIPPQG
ncbi:uncharacterized protein Z520_08026 [Fonsecaea multimorphosa CBS 102226]|uniref:Clr5 domain-containing protein n=1 Tax=Fonsecaea multimorphosa CBS 102226 TaxID=1442371 RepID=A0A0D2KHV4_9EURO|nr:uncharacterized protein Z520_08026 [Fonsecaea multimorphosa CBS 102226]KIX96248.1 hypothetical protein Z520_08026 [Fonsecaea multimorphosa CBS 102226]